jgi:hypothetical protein
MADDVLQNNHRVYTRHVENEIKVIQAFAKSPADQP